MKKFLLFLIVLISLFSSNAKAFEKDLIYLPSEDDTLPVVINHFKPEMKDFPDEFSKISTYKIDAINPAKETNKPGAFFPGFRGADQLVVYTSEYGKYTDTNEYGKEATVIDGVVFGFNGANSFIPEKGYVISGHGKAKKWINQNLSEGAYVRIYPGSMKIESVINPQSYLYKANHKLTEVRKIMLNYKRILPGYKCGPAQSYYNASMDQFHKGKYYISEEKYEEALKSFDSSILLAKEAFYHSIPASKNEFHGVWLRPVEKNRSEIANTLDKLKDIGINNVFLETYYHGYTIFPSKTMEKYGLTKQRPEFKDWDPLKAWIEEAKKRNIHIHAWFQTFYLGNESVIQTPEHILFIYPEWTNKQRKNAQSLFPAPSSLEHNGYFLDPANHLVRKFLLSLIGEISENYEIAGLNIDYIRYPKSLSFDHEEYLDSGWGYTKYAREEFKKNFGRDPVDLDEKHILWGKWVEYRQKKVNELVFNLKSAVNNENILLSAVIFPDSQDVSLTKFQNWSEWTENSSVDAFTPLIMSSDEYRAADSVKEIKKLSGDNIKILPGLFEPFTLGDPVSLLHQIRAIRQTGASGFVLFDRAHLNEDFVKALKTRVLRN